MTCADGGVRILHDLSGEVGLCKVPRTRSCNLGCTSTLIVEMQPRLNSCCRDALNLVRTAVDSKNCPRICISGALSAFSYEAGSAVQMRRGRGVVTHRASGPPGLLASSTRPGWTKPDS